MRTTPREETARANTQPFLSAGSAMARNVAEASWRWRRHYQVHNEAIVIPETIDCIRAMTGIEIDGAASIAKTDRSLGIRKSFLPSNLPA